MDVESSICSSKKISDFPDLPGSSGDIDGCQGIDNLELVFHEGHLR